MSYQWWEKEDYITYINKLETENRELKERVLELETDRDELSYRIRTELEPRIKEEKRAYDRWVTRAPE